MYSLPAGTVNVYPLKNDNSTVELLYIQNGTTVHFKITLSVVELFVHGSYLYSFLFVVVVVFFFSDFNADVIYEHMHFTFSVTS